MRREGFRHPPCIHAVIRRPPPRRRRRQCVIAALVRQHRQQHIRQHRVRDARRLIGDHPVCPQPPNAPPVPPRRPAMNGNLLPRSLPRPRQRDRQRRPLPHHNLPPRHRRVRPSVRPAPVPGIQEPRQHLVPQKPCLLVRGATTSCRQSRSSRASVAISSDSASVFPTAARTPPPAPVPDSRRTAPAPGGGTTPRADAPAPAAAPPTLPAPPRPPHSVSVPIRKLRLWLG